MQAIVTKYYGAGNVRGARIIAKTASGLKVSVPYDPDLDADQNHRNVAKHLAESLGWTNELLGGGLSDSEEVWVMIPRDMKLVSVTP